MYARAPILSRSRSGCSDRAEGRGRRMDLGKTRRVGSNAPSIAILVVLVVLIPPVLALVPSFLLIKSLGLINTRWALILPYMAAGQVLAIFIMRSFFAGLPEELFEAARVDGAGEIRAFWQIAIPLTRPIL